MIYENTDQKQTTRVGSNWEWETRVIVRREEEHGSISGPESVDETDIFSGFENNLIMNQTYTHTFQCSYQLSFYPFDTQVNTNFPIYKNASVSCILKDGPLSSIQLPIICPVSDVLH